MFVNGDGTAVCRCKDSDNILVLCVRFRTIFVR